MDDLNLREVLVKKPFTRVLVDGYMGGAQITDETSFRDDFDLIKRQVVTQADFLREYEPSAHAINSEKYYPDIIKFDEEHKRYYKEKVVRCAFAFQRVIAIKQIVHLIGNDIQFELPNLEKERNISINRAISNIDEMFGIFREGWAEKNMEIHMYDAVKSYKLTGDTAIVGYFNKQCRFGARVLSYLNGDKLYPHFDSITGELELLARKYYDFDEDGHAKIEWVEVWDNKFLYRYKRDVSGKGSIKTIIKEMFNLTGFTLVSKRPHGFQFIPVAYHRDDEGACWSASQDSIEQYELAFSQMSQNNRAYAFPIMYFKGDDVDIQGDMSGAVKSISMGVDDEAGFLQRQEVSEAFNKQLNVLYKLIYELSFAVQPPELKSGDLPGVAVKLLFSPAYEKALVDAQHLNKFLDDVVRIYKAGYGTEIGKYTQLLGLEVNAWIEPYIHQNDTELITNLAQGVQNDFISRQTASERASKYTKNDEFDRIMREKKELQQMDILEAMAKDEAETDEEIRKQEELKKLNSGSDVNTAHGTKAGRPNRSGNKWDENGNYEGRNGWREGEEYK